MQAYYCATTARSTEEELSGSIHRRSIAVSGACQRLFGHCCDGRPAAACYGIQRHGSQGDFEGMHRSSETVSSEMHILHAQ